MAEELMENTEKLSKPDAEEAITNLNSQDQTTKHMLLEMLKDNLIEIYRSFDNPKDVKVSLTESGTKMFTTATF